MKFVSLFSGAMGLDIGLEMAGFETAVCVENDKEAVTTIKHNKPCLPVFDKSITDVCGNELKIAGGFENIPLVAGGPPCQAFSVFGNRLGLEDSRGQLVFEFIRIVNELKPSTFLMENVRGLLSMSIVPNKKDLKENHGVPDECFKKGSLIKLVVSHFETK
jgi:DNA (cytosine-5)-methyltransferase 1